MPVYELTGWLAIWAYCRAGICLAPKRMCFLLVITDGTRAKGEFEHKLHRVKGRTVVPWGMLAPCVQAHAATPQLSTIRDHTGSGVGNNPDENRARDEEAAQVRLRGRCRVSLG